MRRHRKVSQARFGPMTLHAQSRGLKEVAANAETSSAFAITPGATTHAKSPSAFITVYTPQ